MGRLERQLEKQEQEIKGQEIRLKEIDSILAGDEIYQYGDHKEVQTLYENRLSLEQELEPLLQEWMRLHDEVAKLRETIDALESK
jgi:predicted  nucleic acid-binding Zn-ribbon protein